MVVLQISRRYHVKFQIVHFHALKTRGRDYDILSAHKKISLSQVYFMLCSLDNTQAYWLLKIKLLYYRIYFAGTVTGDQDPTGKIRLIKTENLNTFLVCSFKRKFLLHFIQKCRLDRTRNKVIKIG